MRKDSRAIVFLEKQFSKFVKDVGTNVMLKLFSAFVAVSVSIS